MYNEFVYVLKAGPFFKIGKTTDVTRRVAQLAVQLPFPVELFKVINTDDSTFLEGALHEMHKEERVNGEWFELSKDSAVNLFLLPGSMPISDERRKDAANRWAELLSDIEDVIVLKNFIPSVTAGIEEARRRDLLACNGVG